MRILVLIKQVPDSTTRIKIAAGGTDIDRTGVKLVVNPFDEFAIEQAVRLREARSDIEQITALTVGPAKAAEALRTALAVGCDDGIHIQDDAFAGFDELQTARLIATAVKDGGYDLILVGKQEIDLDSGHVGPAVAEFLDLPHVGTAVKFELAADGKSFTANRRVEGAEETVQVTLPAVVTCEKGLCEMRYPSLPNLMKAKKKPIKQVTAADVPDAASLFASVGGTKMADLQPPPSRPPGKVIPGEPEEAVKELVRLLREEAKAI
ncbi:MAG: electron transfer flavoprotein subunit beta/FixA family protein [Phycisphaerae bacterium]|nr:electron transfer flavoprotein subunit beta/FixA family protein [Phycisphaerae bacterium]